MNTPRMRERQQRIGASSTSRDYAKDAVRALADLKRLGKPKPISHRHTHNVRDHVEDGTIGNEARFVLMEYREDGNLQLKSKMMTRLEAFKRNATLRGTGFAWALCNSTT